MEIIFLITGIFIGLLIGFLAAKSKYAVKSGVAFEEVEIIKTDKTKAEERNLILERNNIELKKEIDETRNKFSELNKDYSKVAAQNENLIEKLNEQKAEIEKIQENFRNEFKNLANEILEDKSKRFTDQNKELVQGLLKPLEKNITDFQNRINDIHTSDTASRASLLEQIKQLSELNKQMSQDADNLTKALKGESKTQGTWGEFILESILDKSGLIKNEQYKVQESLIGEDGKRLQPDVIVYLPDNKNIIIDSKVSLVSYERYISSNNDKEKEDYLREHIKSIENHIKGLSEKKYQNIYDLNTLDFVIMFIPIEPASNLALQFDPNLLYNALERKIVIVSPTTLIMTLRIIVNIWRQENQTKNAQRIAQESGALYDKFTGFVSDLESIGLKLKQSYESYESAYSKLSTGKGNIFKRIENLKDLGAKTNKSLPTNLLDSADEE